MTTILQAVGTRTWRSATRGAILTLFLSCIPTAVAQTATVQDKTMALARAVAAADMASLSIPVGAPVVAETPTVLALDPADPVSVMLQQAETAHNTKQVLLSDMVAEGTVTVVAASGNTVFGVTLLRNGQHLAQRILLVQPDGKLWDGKGEHLAPGGRQALEFLETQHARGLRQLLDAPNRDATIAKDGLKDTAQQLTVVEKNGDATQYFLDTATARIARFEFVRSLSKDAPARTAPQVQAYDFRDFRVADGVATSFRVERAVDGVTQETLQLTKVRYIAIPTTLTAPPAGK